MKREASEGFITKAITALCLALISGCAAQQQRAVNEAYTAGQLAKSDAVSSCANAPALCIKNCAALAPAAQEKCVDKCDNTGECMLGNGLIFAGGGGDSVPVVRSDLDVVMNSSLLGTGVNALSQVKQSNNAKEVALAQTDASVRIAESGDARQVGIVQAATGSNTAIAGTVGTVAAAGIGALGTAATSANTAGAANVAALAGMTAALPPTTQITAGGSITQAGRDSDQSQTGRDRVTGNNNETARQTRCVALGGLGAPATGTSNSTATGTTNPASSAYNVLTGGNGAPAANDCGGG